MWKSCLSILHIEKNISSTLVSCCVHYYLFIIIKILSWSLFYSQLRVIPQNLHLTWEVQMEISPIPFKSTLFLFSTLHIFFFYLCTEEPYSASIRTQSDQEDTNEVSFLLDRIAKGKVSGWYFPDLKILTSIARLNIRSQANKHTIKKIKVSKRIRFKAQHFQA